MSTPLFKDFTKAVKDLFKYDKYDFGNQVEVKGSSGQAKWNTKVTIDEGNNVKPKLTAETTTDWAKFEVTEDLRKGLTTLEIEKKKALREVDVKFTGRSDGSFDVEGTYKPSGSFWNTQVLGKYCPPDADGNRVCTTDVSAAVGDDDLGLSVGGKVIFEDKGKRSSVADTTLKTYSLGFRYQKQADSSYSLTFTPQKKGGALEYSLTAHQKFSDKCTIAARAEGRADTQVVGAEIPTLTLAGAWLVNGNNVQSFFNTNKEFGVAYKFNVNQSLAANLGVTSLLDKDRNALTTRFGWKFVIG